MCSIAPSYYNMSSIEKSFILCTFGVHVGESDISSLSFETKKTKRMLVPVWHLVMYAICMHK